MPSLPETPPTVVRPRATVLGAWLEGWRRTIRAPALVVGVWTVTTVVTLPLAAMLHDDLTAHFGSSLASERALQGWDPDWTGEFASGASGIGSTLTREVLGAAGMVGAVGRIFDAEWPPPALAGAIALYLAIWVFLSGAVVDRLARARPLGLATFTALGGHYFFRLLRLAVLAGAAYWVLFRAAHPFLFGTMFDRLTRNLESEPLALAVLAALYALFGLLLGLVSLTVDFTRVRLVVEDRHSVLSGLAAGLRFVRRRFRRVVGLYALNLLGLAVLARLWMQVAVGAEGPELPALLVSQAYLVARVWARLAFFGSEVAFFQGELAHARYTAAPLPRWPDSASVEAVRNLRHG